MTKFRTPKITDPYDCQIIRIRNEYLVCVQTDENNQPVSLVWSINRYDAARIKRPDVARVIAKKLGAKTEWFNPITGDHGMAVKA